MCFHNMRGMGNLRFGADSRRESSNLVTWLNSSHLAASMAPPVPALSLQCMATTSAGWRRLKLIAETNIFTSRSFNQITAGAGTTCFLPVMHQKFVERFS